LSNSSNVSSNDINQSGNCVNNELNELNKEIFVSKLEWEYFNKITKEKKGNFLNLIYHLEEGLKGNYLSNNYLNDLSKLAEEKPDSSTKSQDLIEPNATDKAVFNSSSNLPQLTPHQLPQQIPQNVISQQPNINLNVIPFSFFGNTNNNINNYFPSYFNSFNNFLTRPYSNSFNVQDTLLENKLLEILLHDKYKQAYNCSPFNYNPDKQ